MLKNKLTAMVFYSIMSIASCYGMIEDEGNFYHDWLEITEIDCEQMTQEIQIQLALQDDNESNQENIAILKLIEEKNALMLHAIKLELEYVKMIENNFTK